MTSWIVHPITCHVEEQHRHVTIKSYNTLHSTSLVSSVYFCLFFPLFLFLQFALSRDSQEEEDKEKKVIYTEVYNNG